ncbi:MAG: endonuclease III [Gammaproteobacteria bacterium]|nr:MAG: endonuclease III [Gammaproteobacteria bacterium]
MTEQDIKSIFEIWQNQNPDPKCELIHKNNFELLIAVMLSAQATDISVNKITPNLFKLAPDPKTTTAIGKQKLKQQIKSIGLFNNKAKNIIKTCHILEKKHQGLVPDSFADLIQLPGVGRKTANVVLNTAFNRPTIGVDTHIFRLSNRLKLASGKTSDIVEKKLMQVIPQEYIINSHHWMILHGRHVCKAQNPQCQTCLIKKFCQMA